MSSIPEVSNALESGARRRVALICDLFEEKWISMDYVAEILAEHLEANHALEFCFQHLRPSMVLRFTQVPGLARHRACRNADLLLNRFLDYPRWLRARAPTFDLFHLVDHSYAQLIHHLPEERTIVTCHDLDAFGCLLDRHSEKRPPWFRAMMRRVLEGMQRAAHVIAVSHAVRDQMVRHAIVSPDKISVFPNGVHPSCRPWPDAAADAEAAHLLPLDTFGAILLLNVGSTIRRKRLDLLLRVFAAVRRELPKVLLIRLGGAWTPSQVQLARDLGVDQAIVVLPYVTRPVLAAVYRRADLLIHTADAEGFGMTLIEAQACGCPVVASDLTVLREVGGMPAAFVPVGDIAAWSRTIVELLCERASGHPSWQLRRTESIENARRFSWAETAARTVNVYESVLLAASCPPGSSSLRNG